MNPIKPMKTTTPSTRRQMKTKKCHVSNFGCYAPTGADFAGYLTYHDSPRYIDAPPDQLEAWTRSPLGAVRAAARIEIAERQLANWRQERRT